MVATASVARRSTAASIKYKKMTIGRAYKPAVGCRVISKISTDAPANIQINKPRGLRIAAPGSSTQWH